MRYQFVFDSVKRDDMLTMVCYHTFFVFLCEKTNNLMVSIWYLTTDKNSNKRVDVVQANKHKKYGTNELSRQK